MAETRVLTSGDLPEILVQLAIPNWVGSPRESYCMTGLPLSPLGKNELSKNKNYEFGTFSTRIWKLNIPCADDVKGSEISDSKFLT